MLEKHFDDLEKAPVNFLKLCNLAVRYKEPAVKLGKMPELRAGRVYLATVKTTSKTFHAIVIDTRSTSFLLIDGKLYQIELIQILMTYRSK